MLTDDEKDQIVRHCWGSGEYPCLDDLKHRHALGCRMLGCDLKNGDVEPGMFSTIESIIAERERRAWARGHGTTCEGVHDKTWSLDGCEQHNPYGTGDQ